LVFQILSVKYLVFWYFKYYFSSICILVFQILKCEYFAHLCKIVIKFAYGKYRRLIKQFTGTL